MLESNYDYLILYKMIDWGERGGGEENSFLKCRKVGFARSYLNLTSRRNR